MRLVSGLSFLRRVSGSSFCSAPGRLARRLVGLAALVSFSALPFGVSLIGCSKGAAPVVYCNGSDTGPRVGDVAQIVLSPNLATVGESLNYGQIGTQLSASATDCKGNSVTVRSYTYSSTSSYTVNTGGGPIIADINPANGQVCGGTWNRFTGGGVADFTTCFPPASTPTQYLALVTATASGATSNAVPVYVHPIVTGVVLGGATPPGSNDPGTDTCPTSTVGTIVSAPIYNATGCLSQKSVGQLVARVYANGNTLPASNITCKVGHISYAAQSAAGIVSIDQNGVATADQPGSTILTATISQSSTGTSAGYFSTCPPAAITLSIPGQPAGTSAINVSLNNLQPLTAAVTDTNGQIITGLGLEFESTTPQTIPASVGSVTPVFPGSGTITAICQPNSCNPAPFSQIGLYGNGKPVTSNGITITSPGNSSTVIYMGSTSSQYIQPMDFTTGQPSNSIKLPYVPNSMVITLDGTAIYLGSPQGLMTVTTAANAVGNTNQSLPGTVLSVSPDGTTVVVTDPVRQTVSLVAAASGGVLTSYGGVGTHAQWTPDSQTVYVTTTANNLLTHAAFTNWQSTPLNGQDATYNDVTVMVPSIGAYFAGQYTEGRSYCPTTTLSGTGSPQNATNVFSPLADEEAAPTDRVAATNDGKHILGATAAPAALKDLALNFTAQTPVTNAPNGPAGCTTTTGPVQFTSTPATIALTGITPTAITGVVPTSNSALAFVTYTGTSGLLPVYVPATGALSFVTLANGATTASAPVAGVVSSDNLSFYAGTSGDDQVHILSITGTTVKETGVLAPKLPDANGNIQPVNLIVQRPKKATS